MNPGTAKPNELWKAVSQMHPIQALLNKALVQVSATDRTQAVFCILFDYMFC